MVASRLESRACSRLVSRVCLARPVNSPAWASRFSTRAILGDELHGGLLADAGHAGDVVGRVAHQRQHIHHLLGPLHAPAALNLGQAEDLHAARRSARACR